MPNRAARLGLRGIGRASSEARPSGSLASRITWVADSAAGSSTSYAFRLRLSLASDNNRSSSESQRATVACSSRNSDSSASMRRPFRARLLHQRDRFEPALVRRQRRTAPARAPWVCSASSGFSSFSSGCSAHAMTRSPACFFSVSRYDDGPARAFLRRPPPVPGRDQDLLRARERDVPEPPLLQRVDLLALVGERLQPRVRQVVEVGQRVRVTAQRPRQHLRVGGPLVPATVRREHLVHQGRHEHDRPLQPLRPVRGQQLHRVRFTRYCEVETGGVLLLGRQVRQQPVQRAVRLGGDEVAHGIQKRGEVVATAGVDVIRGRGQLDVEPDRADHPAYQVEQRLSRVRAQLPQLGRQLPEPIECLRRVPPAGRPRIVDRLGQRDHLGRVHPGDRSIEGRDQVVGGRSVAARRRASGSDWPAARGHGDRSGTAGRSGSAASRRSRSGR